MYRITVSNTTPAGTERWTEGQGGDTGIGTEGRDRAEGQMYKDRDRENGTWTEGWVQSDTERGTGQGQRDRDMLRFGGL